LGVTEQGLAGIVSTRGNPDCHVILRGGVNGPNYDAISVQKTLAALRDAGLPPRLMIDTSHGNSDKDYRRQPLVAHDIGAPVAQADVTFAAAWRSPGTVRRSIPGLRRSTVTRSAWRPCTPWSSSSSTSSTAPVR